MKIKFLATVVLTTAFDICIAQNNFVNNGQFESGSSQPNCFNINCASFYDISDDIYDWHDADARLGCLFNYSSYPCPKWCELPLPSSRCVFMQAKDWYGGCFLSFSRYKYYDAVRTGTIQQLQSNNYYILRIKYASTSKKNDNGNPLPSVGNLSQLLWDPPSRIRITFSEWANNWNASVANKLYFYIYPDGAGWQARSYLFSTLQGNSNSFYNSLTNFAIWVREGAFYVDEVEAYKACPDHFLFESTQYYFQEPSFKSSNYIKAGYDVGAYTPNGNVIIKFSGGISYYASNYIDLFPGFEVEDQGVFKAEIKPCDYGTREENESEQDEIIIQEDSIHYTYNTDTLACPIDTLHFDGIDGDTSYANYFWDFGNGQNSTNKSVDIYYSEPGIYNLTLILTDSSNVSDTLIRHIVVPDCDTNSRIGNYIDQTDENIISIKPNPNNGKFNIAFVGDKNSEKEINIYDMVGKKILALKNINVSSLNIDLRPNPLGIYLIKVKYGETIIIRKIIYM